MVMRVVTALLLCLGLLWAAEAQKKSPWWENSVIYQVYPRSFKDSNGDGIGDLNGVTSLLKHIKDIGVDAFWLSPIYKGPQKDYGYDISNYTNIDPIFGTIKDFQKLVKEAKKLGLKVILDFVPNHTSDQHEWFKKSIKKIAPYDKYYIWADAKKDPKDPKKRLPPSNWISVFGQSAWTWNEERQQYYYHNYIPGQPDLNYRNPKVHDEINKVLKFWLKLGVDGFRVDAVNHMYEVEDLKDEPLSNKPVPDDDYDYLIHTMTRDLPENPKLAGEWRSVLDGHTIEDKSDEKLLILELYLTSFPKLQAYYDAGTMPFNMMFISDLTNTSTPGDWKRVIETWLNSVPDGQITNWVVDNHDYARAPTRFGEKRGDFLNMMAIMLPGIAVFYNGDEIGMTNRYFTWKETIDPAGCNAGPERYQLKSRDPVRTPFQWNSSHAAGFSKAKKTWLPVNENYKTLNLKAQKKAEVSHYHVFKALTKLKKDKVLRDGSVTLLEKDNVLAVLRKLNNKKVVLLSNFGKKSVKLDAYNWLNIDQKMKVYTANVESGLKVGKVVDTSKFKIPGEASVILT